MRRERGKKGRGSESEREGGREGGNNEINPREEREAGRDCQSEGEEGM